MAYEKLNLADGTVLSAEHLEHIESGIENSGGIGKVGSSCTATGTYAHAEGRNTVASGHNSHAEGRNTVSSGLHSHAEGYYTVAGSWYQHVQGKCNIEDAADKYAHIVGNGESETARSNAHTLDWNGVPWYAGDRVMLGGTGMDDENAVALMPPLIVTISEPVAGTYAANKTVEEIFAAFKAGRIVAARWNGAMYQLNVANDLAAMFSLIQTGGGVVLLETITVNTEGVVYETSFGGFLPLVSSDDNGKTLKVVDGKWALV